MNPHGRAQTHGHATGGRVTPEYDAWRNMLRRCSEPSNISYRNYGGRGIRVCDRWLSFAVFLADMGEKPSPDHSLDRVDNDGNYEPANCRWATKAEQSRNRRGQKLTPEVATDIRARRASGETLQSIADSVGCTKQMVWLVVHGKKWQPCAS